MYMHVFVCLTLVCLARAVLRDPRAFTSFCVPRKRYLVLHAVCDRYLGFVLMVLFPTRIYSVSLRSRRGFSQGLGAYVFGANVRIAYRGRWTALDSALVD